MTARRSSSQWHSAEFETFRLLLDPENPRVLAPAGADQAQLRQLLIQTEDIATLAHGIARYGRLLPGERLVVVIERNNSIVVLEGNRRLCACQALLDPTSVPVQYRSQFPPAISTETRAALSKLEVDVAPSRANAEIFITRRHTQNGILRWTPLAQFRRVRRLLAQDMSIKEIEAAFEYVPHRLRRIISGGSALETILALPCWTEAEKEILLHPRLKTNPLTRFFELEGVKARLRIKVSPEGEYQWSDDEGTTAHYLETLTRGFLLPAPGKSKPRFNTRSTPEEVLSDLFPSEQPEEVDLEVPAPRPPIGSPSPDPRPEPPHSPPTKGQPAPPLRRAPSPKPVSFFEDLVVHVDDNLLQQVGRELIAINYKDFPTAAAFLTRVTLEKILIFHIEKAGLKAELRSQYNQKARGGNREPTLEYILDFSTRRSGDIFAINVARLLTLFKRDHKDHLDLLVHAIWVRANPQTLAQLADELREFLSMALRGDLVKS